MDFNLPVKKRAFELTYSTTAKSLSFKAEVPLKVGVNGSNQSEKGRAGKELGFLDRVRLTYYTYFLA